MRSDFIRVTRVAAALAVGTLTGSFFATSADAAPRHKRHHHHHVAIIAHPVVAYDTFRLGIDRDAFQPLNRCGIDTGNCYRVIASLERLQCAVDYTQRQGRRVAFGEKLQDFRAAIVAGCGNQIARSNVIFAKY